MKSSQEHICVYGARVHNLKNIDLEIPRNKLVIFTGKSGSGKSSLAFDTIYAEGQRRYLETFNAYARRFLGNMKRPEVEKITGLSPVVAIEQKTTSKNPRSTVGTVTEIYDYLRLLFARIGIPHSYNTGNKMIRFSEKEIINLLYNEFNKNSITVLAPVVHARKGNYQDLFIKLLKKGFLKARIDGVIHDITPSLRLDRYKIHDIEIVLDRLTINKNVLERLATSIKLALKEGDGTIMILIEGDDKARYFSKNIMCKETGIAYKNPEPNSFSFNSPKGACEECNGLGFHKKADVDKIIPNRALSIQQGAIAPIINQKSDWLLNQLKLVGHKMGFSLSMPIKNINDEGLSAILFGFNGDVKIKLDSAKITHAYKVKFQGIANFIEEQYRLSYVKSVQRWADLYMSAYNCKSCNGTRLNIESRHYQIAGMKIYELNQMDIVDFYSWLQKLEKKINKREWMIAQQVIHELTKRVEFILDVGLSYLSLDRRSATLSGGESQRIRLATQIGSKLTNILYILDEPSIGLHQRDNLKLIKSLKNLRDLGNSVIVVEHDKEMITSSDFLVDLGPEAGVYGGSVVASGNVKNFISNKNITAQYLNGLRKIKIPKRRRKGNGEFLRLFGASGNNLKNIDLHIPLGLLCCVTGVSGSGKSTLINETLYPILNQHFYRGVKCPLPYKEIKGAHHIDKVIEVNQAPIGRTPRSNPVTYVGVFSSIRELFANLPESKIRGYKLGRFSFNVEGGRCESCKGAGVKTIEMNFLPDVLVDCEKCHGKRYNKETLDVRYRGCSISDVLNFTVDEAVDFFKHIPSILKKIKTLQDVGLGYISLGQASTTLSGGEAQRIKLSAELAKRSTGNTFYILDEPTTGLHFEDIQVFLRVINAIVEKGNSVLIIEHNMDVIKVADYIIDIGLEGGKEGGTIICNGSPEEIILDKFSYTAKYLKRELQNK
ncbi:MAG: excinuclease ABC subunit UvrA [Bacteroidota bacterium]|nr:excinuclease ABC subunit UvrA [Bacteroidota bacterium]